MGTESMSSGNRQFDFSKLSQDNALRIASLSKRHAKGELSGKTITRMGEAIGSIQNKTFLNKIADFFSHITRATRQHFLLN